MAATAERGQWYQLHVALPAGLREIAIALLADSDAAGFQELEHKVIAYFRRSSPPLEVAKSLRRELRRLGHILPAGAVRVCKLRQEDWAESWKASLAPLQASPRILVCPSWSAAPPPTDSIVIHLDPGMAFGSGHHATTRGVLLLLEEFLRPGQRVCDVGTGSGILAIAAYKLGAAKVWACDCDPQAVTVAAANVRKNDATGHVLLWVGSIDACRPADFDLIMANITAQALASLLPALGQALGPHGVLLLSGITDREEEDFVHKMRGVSLRPVRRLQIEEWVSLATVPTS